MKQILKLIVVASLSQPITAQTLQPAYQIVDNDTTCEVFIYSPGPHDGLHLAYLADDERWRDAGQLCSSDYSAWGSEKRMYNPFVLRANDGTWRLLFGVNDYSPCFAAAYSEDLVIWRPQDYPRMNEKGVLEPVMFQMDDGTFDIYFKTKNGQRRYVQATQDFRHFTESPDPSTIDDVAWMRDTATVDGKKMEGNLFEVPKMHLDYIFQHFAALRNDAKMSAERMADDTKRFASIGREVKATLTVNGSDKKSISDKLIGVFFEDINQSADGGLYAELVQNRDFEYTNDDHKGWGPTTAWRSSKPLKIETEVPLSKNNPHYVVLDRDTLYNIGWDGITDKGGLYDFSFYVRNIDNPKNQFEVALVSSDGTVLAEERVKTEGQGWNRYTLTLNTESKKRTGKLSGCQLRIIARKEGRVAVDMVSLFPHDTYKSHGLRRDLAEAIAALKPKFVRFPGGCMSHGQGLDNIYHWNESVGPWQDRKPAKNIWNYHQTRGLGFYEYFQFCEDIGAEPLPVLAAGVPCQNSVPDKDGYGGQQGGIPMKDMPAYCEEILHLIEWANGDPNTSKWAKMRADAGHPAPFHLKYIGIGNEDLISTAFEERYEMICKAIRKKYPDIKICGTVGPFHYPSADYVEGWKFTNAHKEMLDLVDEHYYESPGWFMHHQDYYDQYDRNGVKVYLGEYASQGRTVENALVEAMHLCSLERNGDVVEMSSYAPLLCREKHANWNPNMIYFDSDTITSLTPSYYTQYLFGNNSGDQYISSKWNISDELRHRVAASIVRNSKTGRTYLKLVNALPASLTVSIKGVNIPANAHITGFYGKPSDNAVNLERGEAGGATLTLKPYSFQVIEM